MKKMHISDHDLETCTEKQEKVTGETPIQEAPDYEKLLVENRKSFREALRRQRKANAILHAEIERLKVLVPVQEHKPESEENLATEYANINFQHCTYHYADDKRLTDFDAIKQAYLAGYRERNKDLK